VCVNLSGIAIKKAIALALALSLIAPVAHSVQTTSIAATKKATITPSPSPVWPPKGFIKSKDGNTYAKIPTPKELVGLASNDKKLTAALAEKIDGVREVFMWSSHCCINDWLYVVGSYRKP
jgi:hypothetical protein